ncbi:hypothetical protein BD311DRAFT_743898 [Dichomitus squalens]|uniref:Uncharacterized protein n=1 Tax=Dichomitus squalens TaxID=114155 RepID=A0A4Q9N443_9APHY|nr:hypothetical protein BD311DRAFT_743898 [Dichomitus squalens]
MYTTHGLDHVGLPLAVVFCIIQGLLSDRLQAMTIFTIYTCTRTRSLPSAAVPLKSTFGAKASDDH